MARILMVIRPTRGGAFGHVLRLSSELSRRGHVVGVCGPHDERHAELEAAGAELFAVRMDRPISPLRDARPLAAIAGVYRRFRPDLIHGHGSKGPVLAKLARAARPSVPLAYTPHQYAFANYFASAAQQRAYRLIERSVARLANMVICVCEAERELACQIGPCERTRVVYNGVAVPDPAPPPDPGIAALRDRGPVLCAVAELHPRKGIVSLLEAMPAVLAVHPGATLAIAGEGEERQALERRSSGLGLSDSVRLLGHVTGVDRVLAASDAFVNPAWAEAFPYAVLEAMAARMPVVATDVGGTGEAIEDGVTGRLVAPRDPAALSSAIVGLLGDRERAAQLAAHARARVEERFSLSGMIHNTLAAYSELGVPAEG